MKLLLPTPLPVLFALLPACVKGSCLSGGEEQCQKGSGNCTSAVLVAVTPGGSLNDAISTLSYGKYCGRFDKCIPIEGVPPNEDFCQVGVDEPCPPPACGAVDDSCAVHDACLDNELEILGGAPGDPVPMPQRCKCDVGFVASLAIQAATTGTTGLCDDNFYTLALPPLGGITPIELLKHEAVLMAVPYCCNVLSAPENSTEATCAQDAVTNGYDSEYTTAATFCTQALDGLKSAGVDLCPAYTVGPDPSTPTGSPVPAPTQGTSTGDSLMERLSWAIVFGIIAHTLWLS